MKALRGPEPGETWGDVVRAAARRRGDAVAVAAVNRFQKYTLEFEADPADAAWQALDREGVLPKIEAEEPAEDA